MTAIQTQMLEEMLTWGEYSRSYNDFDIHVDGKAIKKPELQKNMASLREMGFVKMCHGGLSEDGEVVGGTTFMIPYSKIPEIRKLIS